MAIVLVMAGVPGLLFGFVTQRVRITRKDVTITRDFVVWKHRQVRPLAGFRKVGVRLERDHSPRSDNSRSVARRYHDVVLLGDAGRLAIVRFFEKEREAALALAGEVAAFLQLEAEEPVD